MRDFSFAFRGRAGNLRPTMTPDEDSSKAPEPAAPAKRPRSRRSRRGGRGRGRKPGPPTGEPRTELREGPGTSEASTEMVPTAEPAPEEMPIPDSPIEEARREAAEADLAPPEEREYGDDRPAVRP